MPRRQKVVSPEPEPEPEPKPEPEPEVVDIEESALPLPEKKKKVFCEACNKEMLRTSYNNHLKSSRHLKMAQLAEAEA